MNSFYISAIFFGIALIIVALVWIAYDMKKSHDFMKRVDEKKKELLEIISDSEQMLQELNKFSDYIVTQMEIKSEEMSNNLRAVEERIRKINCDVLKDDKVANGAPASHAERSSKPEAVLFNYNSDLIIDSIDFENAGLINVHTGKPASKKKDKVIPINNRHKEVLRLSESGLDDTEIARKLNMGKGEIQLILEMNR